VRNDSRANATELCTLRSSRWSERTAVSPWRLTVRSKTDVDPQSLRPVRMTGDARLDYRLGPCEDTEVDNWTKAGSEWSAEHQRGSGPCHRSRCDRSFVALVMGESPNGRNRWHDSIPPKYAKNGIDPVRTEIIGLRLPSFLTALGGSVVSRNDGRFASVNRFKPEIFVAENKRLIKYRFLCNTLAYVASISQYSCKTIVKCLQKLHLVK